MAMAFASRAATTRSRHCVNSGSLVAPFARGRARCGRDSGYCTRRFRVPALWQRGFELPPHPFKVTPQLDDDRTVREMRTVHVVGYEGYSKPSPSTVLGTNEKPKTKGANCERRYPGGNGIAAQATDEPSGYRSHKTNATNQNRIVSHPALHFGMLAIPVLPNDRGIVLTSL